MVVRSKDSNFRRELMEILQQPFSEQEYEKLWNEVSCRKPVQREKELRTRCFQIQDDHSAKSYLDHNRGKLINMHLFLQIARLSFHAFY